MDKSTFYSHLTTKRIHELCKLRGIKRYSKKNRKYLIELLVLIDEMNNVQSVNHV